MNNELEKVIIDRLIDCIHDVFINGECAELWGSIGLTRGQLEELVALSEATNVAVEFMSAEDSYINKVRADLALFQNGECNGHKH